MEQRIFEDEGMNDLLNLLVDAEDEAKLEVERARAELNKAWRKLRRVQKAVKAFDRLDRGEIELMWQPANVEIR